MNTRASAVGSTNSERCCSSRRITERATGTERFERVVLGSLSKVTWPSQLDGRGGDADAGAQRVDVASAQTCSFSPAKSGVRADQHEGAILTRHLVDEALNLALR